MINIKILCVGKIKEKSMQDTLNEYVKKLSKFAKVDIIELQDEKIPETKNKSDELKVIDIESKKIINELNKINKKNIFLCDLSGKEYSSIEFSNLLEKSFISSSTLVFIIGGSLGVNEDLRKIADYKICFSKMTFPHQLFRIFLVEQIYRGFKIINNETYHK